MESPLNPTDKPSLERTVRTVNVLMRFAYAIGLAALACLLIFLLELLKQW
jgi:hypothetical protein